MERNVYLDKKPLEEARNLLFSEVHFPSPRPWEEMSVEESLGRITAKPVFAPISSPHFHASAMDGYAVRSDETYQASEREPVRLKIPDQAVPLDTGDPLPSGMNAVIKVEDVQPIGEEAIEIVASVPPWNYVRVAGEDIVVTELILPENHRIRPCDLGALLAGGITCLPVRRRPRVAVIPTGDELVEPGTQLKSGDIIEFNSRVLCAYAQQWEGEGVRFPIVKDSYEDLCRALNQALETCDIVTINAGSSAGREDFTARVIGDMGKLLVHGVSIMPGKPTVIGIVRNKPVLGIPGYPVSAIISFQEFVRPLMYEFLGIPRPTPKKVKALVPRNIPSRLGNDEYIRVKLGKVGDKIIASPLSRGAAVITSLVKADGIIKISRFSEGINQGEIVEAELLRSEEEIENSVVVIGSHDLTLDLLYTELRRRYPELTLSSTNVGSMGGLMALKNREAHLAGSHLLDTETGRYNFSYIERYLKGVEVTVVHLALREQGLFIPKGNPKGIESLKDLGRKGLRFVNRQKGAGTRILLDHRLKQLGIDPSCIEGYDRVEYTHMAVAMAVASDVADVGLGVMAAARALDLDFIPVEQEQYDLIILKRFLDHPPVAKLLEVIRSPSFREQVAALGGYDVSRMGEIATP